MPTIVSICPYCNVGGVRAPHTAVGASATCPKCGSNFTIFPAEKGKPPPQPVPTSVNETQPTAAMPDVTEPSPVLPGEPRRQRSAEPALTAAPTSRLTLTTPERESPIAVTDLGMVAGLIGLILVGPTMLLSQVPYGRIVALVLALIGLLLGVASLSAERRAKLAGGLAAALNVGILLVVLVLPSWLNLGPWLPTRFVLEQPIGPQAIGNGTNTSAPAGWVDASTASWRYRDVIVTVRSAVVGPLELVGAKGAKRTTKQEYLRVTLRLTNEGTDQPLELEGWAAGDAYDSRLLDAAGQALKPATIDRGWELASGNKATALFPGKAEEVVLLFEAPAQRSKYYRFTLPGDSIGPEETIRFRVPGSFVTSRRTP